VRTARLLSRRARGELDSLQVRVRALCVARDRALRIFVTSRNAATAVAQREFWLEFSWADQEYRAAVRRLAEFCGGHGAVRG